MMFIIRYVLAKRMAVTFALSLNEKRLENYPKEHIQLT